MRYIEKFLEGVEVEWYEIKDIAYMERRLTGYEKNNFRNFHFGFRDNRGWHGTREVEPRLCPADHVFHG
jgi:hypothetical protein